MTTFSGLAPRRTCDVDLVAVDGDDFKTGTNYKEVELPPGRFTATGFQHNSGFQWLHSETLPKFRRTASASSRLRRSRTILRFELKLRPQRLAEFIGQTKVKENLAVAIEAALPRRGLDHVLLYRSPGLGQDDAGRHHRQRARGAIFSRLLVLTLQIKGDLTAILTNVREKQVLFIDEVHRLQPSLEEISLLGARRLQARHHHRSRPCGAHSHAGGEAVHLHRRDHARWLAVFAVALALRNRAAAGVLHVTRICALSWNARPKFWEWKLIEPAPIEIASRSRGTPRIANRLLRRVRDYAQVRAPGRSTCRRLKLHSQMLEVDRYGFDEVDRKLLLTIIEKYQGGPVGVNTLAAALAKNPMRLRKFTSRF